MNKNKRLIYISLLAAQGVVITLLERSIPFPFAFAPGAKLGLANMVTILALFTLPYKDSFKVVWMRLIISTFLGGTLSTFMYSFSGAFLSYFGMIAVRRLGPKRVSLIGVSATGGILHNVGQLIVASTIAQSFSVMLYLPVLAFTGIFSGIAVGIAANYLMEHVVTIQNFQRQEAENDRLTRAWYQANYTKEYQQLE
ncbi:heptaprenyl diphosphate synthase [Jeotgalibaca sp. PTS2502]|uniref:Gx transporter family protein n=1 Tax=Jeotgalibaca arthritidis TaxID=1868794 RepID=A0A6G7K9F6_9LACT|nr:MULTISPECIES: Gx transporter family protein [Jeotgalibaca]APZ49753.1 heptaprenyl diphosphate synthase [Jeotgalibaca sp. PTS2502]QII81886.1 Gx transporter family protein [Jeotgalibaca arthritidis]